MQEVPKVDELIVDGDKRRDAIHVAIAPVMAANDLRPGWPVRFLTDTEYEEYLEGGGKAPKIEAVFKTELEDERCIGVISPFLKTRTGLVHSGERCYAFILPNTVTSLRHVWVNPKFTAVMTSSLRGR